MTYIVQGQGRVSSDKEGFQRRCGWRNVHSWEPEWGNYESRERLGSTQLRTVTTLTPRTGKGKLGGWDLLMEMVGVGWVSTLGKELVAKSRERKAWWWFPNSAQKAAGRLSGELGKQTPTGKYSASPETRTAWPKGRRTLPSMGVKSPPPLSPSNPKGWTLEKGLTG